MLSRLLVAGIAGVLILGRSAWEGHLLSGLLFTSGCVLTALGTIGRVWATLYIAGRKTKELVRSGPYSICRNPLYLFSLLGGLGVALVTETLTIPLLFLVPFALYYPWVIRSEEHRLRAAHGATFDDYCAQVPAFWPRFAALREEETYVVNAVSFRKHIFTALWFVWLIGAIEMVESLHELGVLHARFILY